MAYVKQNWKNGDIITADKLNHMEDGIAEGGGSVQPDWNQNDSTASDYIKNRPFYSSPEMTTLTDSTGHFEGDGQFPYLEMNFSSPVDIDDPITVTFDGVIYDDLEIKWTIHGKGTEEDPFEYEPYIGATYDPDSDEYDWSEYPFVIWLSKDSGDYSVQDTKNISELYVMTNLEGLTHPFKIEYTDEVVHKLDSKYLPSSGELILYQVDSYSPSHVRSFYLDKECTQLFGSTDYYPSSDSEAIQYYNETSEILNSASTVYICRIDGGSASIQKDKYGPIMTFTHHSGYGEEGPNDIKIYFYRLASASVESDKLIDYNSYD